MKKETVTPAEMKEDIAVFVKHRPELSEEKYRFATPLCLIVAIAILILQLFAPGFLLLPLTCVFFLAVAVIIFVNLRIRTRLKNISLEDYGKQVYFVIRVDSSILELIFTLNYFYNLT